MTRFITWRWKDIIQSSRGSVVFVSNPEHTLPTEHTRVSPPLRPYFQMDTRYHLRPLCIFQYSDVLHLELSHSSQCLNPFLRLRLHLTISRRRGSTWTLIDHNIRTIIVWLNHLLIWPSTLSASGDISVITRVENSKAMDSLGLIYGLNHRLHWVSGIFLTLAGRRSLVMTPGIAASGMLKP